MTRLSLTTAILSPLVLLASCGAGSSGDSQAVSTPAPSGGGQPFKLEQIAVFDEPWAAAFVPGTQHLLVTERKGTIKLLDGTGAVVGSVAGAPTVDYGGQGGLGDIAFGPDADPQDDRFPIYLSWAEAGPNDTRGAVVGRGTLVLDEMDGNTRIEGLQVIWRQPKVTGRGHYSHKLAFSPDGRYLFVASGDRQKMDPAQDTSNNIGTIVRLNLDGTPAAGNPFSGQAGQAQDIWSWGHRNTLGLAFDGSGRLWNLEHGPAGGDEINLIERGKNYGWPIVSEGDHYDGRVIPPHSERPEFAAPAIAWTPVIAPGDFIIYSGKLFPEWRGQAIVGGMNPTVLVRVAFDGERAREIARHPMERRIREVVEAPDGAIILIEDKAGARMWRMTPG
jgi:aldose sugar dehydrogenase